MRFALLLSVLFLQPVLSAGAVDPKNEPMPTPLMRTVDPYTAKAGTEVTVSGDHLDKNIVEEVYVSVEGKNVKAEIVDQSAKQIKFRVPAVKPGSYRLVVLVRTVEPLLIEEPVRVAIEE